VEEFSAVLHGAVPAYEFDQAKLFEPRDEQFIRKEVERKLYEPSLPNGGAREGSWVRKFEAIAKRQDLSEDIRWRARTAAEKWEAIRGWYYVRKPLTPTGQKVNYEFHTNGKEASKATQQWDMVWFHDMMLKGLPEGVADFRMECLFLLRRPTGNTDRLVQLRNVVGEKTGLIALPSEEYRAPEKFRGWCLNHGNYHWGGNQVQLQMLHLDIGRATAWRVVNEVSSCGWLPLNLVREPGRVKAEGLWFAGDAVYAPDGSRLTPDDYGVYWYNNEGYRLSDSGRENPFFQKQPRMWPGLEVSAMAKKWVVSTPAPEGAAEATLIRGLYEEMCDRMLRTVGSLDAYMLIGTMLSYAAAPEIFEEHSLFPSAWVHGGAGSGKSTICEWLMEFWGLHLHSGLILRSNTTTAVGLLQAMDQYSNVPVWLDEFRFMDVGPEKLGVLHQAFNRGGQAKFNPSGIQRVIRTNCLISGESTTDDAALRGRYMHVQISREKREKDAEGNDVNHVEWFNAHREYFFIFIRFAIEHRTEFAEMVMKVLAGWRERTAGPNERIKLVYGIPYAAFLAMGHLLESKLVGDPALLAALREHAGSMTGEATADVSADMNINVVWTQLITAFKAKAIPVSCFRLESTDRTCSPGQPAQNMDRWRSYRLFMDPDPTLAALAEYLAKQRAQVALKRKDLRDQLSKEIYWIKGSHRKRFGPGKDTAACWAFDVDRHPLGYLMCDDASYDKFIMKQEEGDPRKGELFSIIHEVEAEERKRENEV
jgi:hypothetical protein